MLVVRAYSLGHVHKNTLATPHRRDPIEDDLCRRHIAVARGGDDGIDDLFGVILHEPFGKNSRLVPRAPWLPGEIAGLAFLKPVSKIWACIFSHGRKSLLKRHRVIERHFPPPRSR
jgi:hypothetical protein